MRYPGRLVTNSGTDSIPRPEGEGIGPIRGAVVAGELSDRSSEPLKKDVASPMGTF
jgi:hypothetical protein